MNFRVATGREWTRVGMGGLSRLCLRNGHRNVGMHFASHKRSTKVLSLNERGERSEMCRYLCRIFAQYEEILIEFLGRIFGAAITA
jgi:hypothetical protein